MIHVVAEKATPPEQAAGRSEQQHHFKSTTMCAYCSDDRNVYQLGDDKWICEDHLKSAVALAACDIWPGSVRYDKAFEDSLW